MLLYIDTWKKNLWNNRCVCVCLMKTAVFDQLQCVTNIVSYGKQEK